MISARAGSAVGVINSVPDGHVLLSRLNIKCIFFSGIQNKKEREVILSSLLVVVTAACNVRYMHLILLTT